ncbi:MAG TPA: sensor histidine kinase [Lacunisphaera sp.]|jgi:signal transduction histidine kinase
MPKRAPFVTKYFPPLAGIFGLLASLGIFGPGVLGADRIEPRGLPFIRTYPLDEIGKVPRGLRMGFDSFGRLAVMYDGIYSVLNDSAWVNRIDPASTNRTLMTTIRAINGKYFYCGRSSWGTVDLTSDGHFHAHPLVPSDAPAWTDVTSFNDAVGTGAGVYFYDLKGVIYWDFARQRNFFFELPRVSTAFHLGARIFASCRDQVLREIHPDSDSVNTVKTTGLEGAVVDRTVSLDASHVLLALQDGRLMSFDGQTAVPWPAQALHGLTGRITALTALVDGGVALAIQGKGVILISADGSLKWALNLPEFSRIGGLAANEPGVLWVAGENAVRKIFYDSPITSFGQELGLSVAWPAITLWKDRLVACSNSTLYEMETALPGTPSRFNPLKPAPEGGASCLASHGAQLLVGNPTGVYAAGDDGRFISVAKIENVAALEFIAPDVCIAIASQEIAALRFVAGRWTECAPRIKGTGDAPIRSMVHGAIWVELGGDHVARLTYREGRLKLQPIQVPWNGAPWTNVGAVGSTVVLSGQMGKRAYYDEKQEKFVAAPALDRLFARCPYSIDRVSEDSSGTLWATHATGVVTFTPEAGDYVVDATTFELRNDTYPWITMLPENDIWIISGRSLFHVERSVKRSSVRPPLMLVSMVADDPNVELQQQNGASLPSPHPTIEGNSLSVRLFSGTYAWRYPPLYEYRLEDSDPWTPVDPSLLMRFPKLRDGDYQLEVHTAEPARPDARPFTLDFVIKPPPYRTPLACVVYAVVLLLLIAGIARWTNHRSLLRNEALERTVEERTHELHVTMEKLNEETRNAATMVERNRLAGEIHDSLQQGLSGSILQLDTTITTASISPEVRARLNIVRGMLSYTREEIQHSVLNLESPLLENSNLGDALGKLAGFINSGSIRMNVGIPDQPISLDSGVQHNLLRIAQEAITNAVKHANAKHIEVTLSRETEAVRLTIADDGAGFDPALRANMEGHFGLRGMRTRARSMKADLHVASSPGTGTTITVSVSLKSPSNDINGQNHPA